MKKLVLILAALAFAVSVAHAAQTNPAASLNRVLAADDWLNGRPTVADVRGKVVVLDFYTFLCYNCKNVQPNLRALYKNDSRHDLVILSVHSPEGQYEHNRAALITSTTQQGVAWPVAIDNDFRIWNAYGVNAWPTQMIFDRHGVLRKTVVGDSQDEVVDATVNELLRERS